MYCVCKYGGFKERRTDSSRRWNYVYDPGLKVLVLLQISILSHDPEGAVGPPGVDPGHSAGWEDLHLCLQRQCGSGTLLWYLQGSSGRTARSSFLVNVSWVCCRLFTRPTQQHWSGSDQDHGQGALQGGRDLQEQLLQKGCLSLRSLLFSGTFESSLRKKSDFAATVTLTLQPKPRSTKFLPEGLL